MGCQHLKGEAVSFFSPSSSMHRKQLWAAVLLSGNLTLKMRPRTSIQSAKFGFEVCCLGHEFFFLFSRNQPQSLASEAVGASPAAADVQS